MAVVRSDAAANAILDGGIPGAWVAGDILELRSGAPPGPGAAATGTLIAAIVLPAAPFAAAAARAKAKQNTWSVAAANAGVIGHYRLKKSTDTNVANQTEIRQEGTATLAGGGGDMIVDNTNVTAGQVVTANTFGFGL